MAEYKSGYKRKGNDDRFLTYLIIAFVAIVIVVVAGLGIYRLANPTLDYDDFEDRTIHSFAEIETRSEEKYFVYYYGEFCGHCITIKEDVLNFANVNDAGIKVYFLESSVPQDVNYVVDPIDTNVTMSGTPTMITVVNGTIVDLNAGYTLVLSVMEKTNEGSYGFID